MKIKIGNHNIWTIFNFPCLMMLFSWLVYYIIFCSSASCFCSIHNKTFLSHFSYWSFSWNSNFIQRIFLLFSMNYSSVSQFFVLLNFQRIHSRFWGFHQKIPRKALKSSWNIKKRQFCFMLDFGEFFISYTSAFYSFLIFLSVFYTIFFYFFTKNGSKENPHKIFIVFQVLKTT